MKVRLVAFALLASLVAPLAAQQPSAVTLVITNGIVVTVNGARRVLNPKGGRAQRQRDRRSRHSGNNRGKIHNGADVAASGRVVMPRTINTHTHAAMVMFRGLGNDLNLMDWLRKHISCAGVRTVSPEVVRAQSASRFAPRQTVRVRSSGSMAGLRPVSICMQPGLLGVSDGWG